MRIRKIVWFGLLLACVVAGCRKKSAQPVTPGQGTIVYSVSYPDSVKYGMKAALFPREVVLVFNKDKATFIASGGMGMVQLINLLDNKSQTATSLLIDNLRDNYGCKLTPDEIQANETAVHYDFEPGGGRKVIAGIQCKEVIAKSGTDGSQFEIYYADSIRFNYWNSPFKGMHNLFLEYTHTVNNLKMKLVAKKVDLVTPVDTSLFELKGEYKWLNQKDYFNYLSAL